MRTRHLGIVIRRSPGAVYAVARDPAELPSWAAGLAAGEVRSEGDSLVVDSPMGEVRVRFAPSNPFGVLDHEVTLPDGTVTLNPLRVLPHPLGSEVVFTLRGTGGGRSGDGGSDDDDEFEQDAAAVAEDLERLRTLLEGPRRPGKSAADRPAATAVIRVAAPTDAGPLGQLLADFNTEFDAQTPDGPTAAARFERLLGREDVLALIARVASEPATDIGFAFLTLRPTPLWDGPLAQLEELYVRQDLRGCGVGTALLTRAVDEVRSRGGGEMLINVDADDVDARRFYERHGFSDRDPDTGSGMRCYLRQLLPGPS